MQEGGGNVMHSTKHCCRLSKKLKCLLSDPETDHAQPCVQMPGAGLYRCHQVLVQDGSQQQGSKVPTPRGAPQGVELIC